MNILVCVKRVPDVGAKINLEDDLKTVSEKNLGFTISPHEEACVQEAIEILEDKEGTSTVMTIGPEGAEEQLRDCLARGIDGGVLLESDHPNWDPVQTAGCLSSEIAKLEEANGKFDLILFGSESADAENSQVHLRVAAELDRPFLSYISGLEVNDDHLLAKRKGADGEECYQLPLPAVLALKDGINLPKHPSLRGTMAAKRKKIDTISVTPADAGKEFLRYERVVQEEQSAEILGEGKAAAGKIVELLKNLEVIE